MIAVFRKKLMFTKASETPTTCSDTLSFTVAKDTTKRQAGQYFSGTLGLLCKYAKTISFS